MLGKIWDDTLGGPKPDSGLNRLRNNSNFNTAQGAEASDGNGNGKPSKFNIRRSLSMENPTSPPSSPTATSSPSASASSTPRDRVNVWRSVFNPGSNLNTKTIGSQKFDQVEPNSPTVYDWLYSGDTKSERR